MARPNPNAGRSILEILWEELDTIVDRLRMDGEPDLDSFPVEPNEEELELELEEWRHWGEMRGQAQGLAYAIAVLTNPYQVDVPKIRQIALNRWKERQQ